MKIHIKDHSPATITSRVTIRPITAAIVLESLWFSLFFSFPVWYLLYLSFLFPPRILHIKHIFRTYFPNMYSLLIYNTTPYLKMEEFFEHLFCFLGSFYGNKKKACRTADLFLFPVLFFPT